MYAISPTAATNLSPFRRHAKVRLKGSPETVEGVIIFDMQYTAEKDSMGRYSPFRFMPGNDPAAEAPFPFWDVQLIVYL